jgi:hypothetical protein
MVLKRKRLWHVWCRESLWKTYKGGIKKCVYVCMDLIMSEADTVYNSDDDCWMDDLMMESDEEQDGMMMMFVWNGLERFQSSQRL